MFFIPVNQIESVDLVIHALKTAAGEADCSTCPARKVCMQQCLALAEGIERLAANNSLPRLDVDDGSSEPSPEKAGPENSGPNLRIIK